MDLKELKKLIEILKDTDISELQLEKEGSKVRIKRHKLISPEESVKLMPVEEKMPATEEKEDAQRLFTVTSPLVGTFYRSPSPDAKSFVEVGDRVGKGQVICIVEAMKLMNEIESEVDGAIVKALVDNAQPVEYGEPLFLIEPL
jgi:acetyl-CoA carboxylase biotin carboxyl carrier protein